LAGVFGEKLIEEKVIDEIKLLSKDSAFSVRKQVAQSIGLICKVSGIEVSSNKIFPIFESLTQDDIWGVRKSCAESLPEISKYVNGDIRKNLVKIFETFSEDISRWVKMESFKQLGPFISTFMNEEVPKELIKHFIGMATQSTQNSDSDLVEYCAFNFPAVVMTVGKDNWSSLEKTFNLLVKDVQWKVRRSLSFSLHEIAKILGSKTTEETLVPAFEVFLRDLDEVKIGVVSNMGKFMEHLSEKTLKEYLKILEELPEETDNWRIKEQVALQIPIISNIISPELIQKVLVKVAISMMEDQYSDVRLAGLICVRNQTKN
jgi:serine/threonine-protein phosphatase 4 regulatory subunit 1